MTKQHYELIAKALAEAEPQAFLLPEGHRVWEQTVRSLAAALSRTNQRFDFDRFLTAAGIVS